MKIAISTSSFASIDTTPLELLKANGLQVVSNPFGRKMNEDEIINHLQGVDGLLAGLEPLNANVFKKCPQLQAITRVGIGMENVDLDAAKKAGIKVSNTPDGPSDSVAEMTLAAALVLSRSILPANAALHQKQWSKIIGKGLKHTKVLVLGYGRIGQKVAELFHAFGAKIMVCDPIIQQASLSPHFQLVGLKEGLSNAEIVTLHTGGNQPILKSSEFESMREGVILMNSARGALIDEVALIEALESGKVSSAWLDVFPEEPYIGRLTEYEQVLLTPHMSTYSVQCRKDMETEAVNTLLRDLGV